MWRGGVRIEEDLLPRVSVRGPRAVWEAAGAKDTYLLARERAKQLAEAPRPPFDLERAAKLAEIIEDAERQT
jgi:hypothetical protein